MSEITPEKVKSSVLAHINGATEWPDYTSAYSAALQISEAYLEQCRVNALKDFTAQKMGADLAALREANQGLAKLVCEKDKANKLLVDALDKAESALKHCSNQSTQDGYTAVRKALAAAGTGES